MSGAVAIFVKIPAVSQVKTKLAETLGQKKADCIHMLSVEATEEIISQVSNNITPYWAVAAKEALNHDMLQSFDIMYTGEENMGQQLHNVYSKLLKKHDYVIMVGVDSPQLSAEMLIRTSQIMQNNDFVIGPSYDGGFYLFAGKKPLNKNIWLETSYSNNYTLDILLEKILKYKFKILDYLTSLDEEYDIEYIINQMPDQPLTKQLKLVRYLSTVVYSHSN